MTPLLENELVWEYFGCQKHEIQVHTELCNKLVPAYDILDSMQQPIKKGERYLAIYKDLSVGEVVCDHGGWTQFHPHALRLPDRFQPSAQEKPVIMDPPNPKDVVLFGYRGDEIQDAIKFARERNWKPKPSDAVEEKIKYIMSKFEPSALTTLVHHELRELVRLAREKV